MYLIPGLRGRFLAYGPRASSASLSAEREKAGREEPDRAPFAILLNRLAEITVPHSWFTSFYAVSVGCSLFWASQVLTGGPAYRLVVHLTGDRNASMTFQQVLVAYAMLLVQGSRRLYECLAFSKPSSSQMWFGHWLLGLLFYIGTSMAVWVEGIRKLPVSCRQPALLTGHKRLCRSTSFPSMTSPSPHPIYEPSSPSSYSSLRPGFNTTATPI